MDALASNALVDRTGVQLHLGYTDTMYGDFGKTRAALLDLGVKHVRAGLPLADPYGPDHPQYVNMRTLASDGIRFTSGVSGDLTRLPDCLTRWMAGAVVALEGPNEPDTKGGDWTGPARAAQTALKTAAPTGTPVIGIPLTSAEAATALGPVPADLGNIHAYYGGRHPETGGWGDNGYGSLPWQLAYMAAPTTGTRPVVASETGYHTETADLEQIQATYLPRVLLSHLAGGITRTFIYELLDERPDPTGTDPERHYGLIRADWTPKPAYAAVKALLAATADPGPTFTAQPLPVTVTGQTGNLRQQLLAKRDGSYVLALWLALPCWDPNKKTPIAVPEQTVTVTPPGTHTITAAARLDGTSQPAGTTVKVGGTVTLLTIRPLFTAAQRDALLARITAAQSVGATILSNMTAAKNLVQQIVTTDT